MIQVIWIHMKKHLMDIELLDVNHGVLEHKQEGNAHEGLDQDHRSIHKALAFAPSRQTGTDWTQLDPTLPD